MNPEMSSTDRFVDRIARSSAFDPLAGAIQSKVREALDGNGPLASLKDILHGKPLGHSLHAPLTDIPVGAWTLAALFDGLQIMGRAEFAPAADVAIGFGMLGGIAAIATGLAEWSDTSGAPKRLGAAHAICNTIGFGAYALSLTLRCKGRRKAGISSAMLGYGVASFAAYLGGELSTGLQIGVRHSAPVIFPPQEYVAVLPDAQLFEEKPRRVDLAGIPVLLSRDARGEVHAISAVCTHRGGPLEEGTFADACVRCPWHGARFTLADGAVQQGPATFPLARFATRVVNGQIEIRTLFT